MDVTNSWYLKTSPLFPKPPAAPPFALPPNARLPENPAMTWSTSAAVSARSPGSGAVCSKASRSSARSIWPLSSSSKALNADSSSELGERAARLVAMVLRNVARGIVCGAEGGKKRATSVAVDGSPAPRDG